MSTTQLASDVTNTEFTGAVKDPWSALSVQFYMNDRIIDQHKTQQNGGRPVYKTKHVPDGEIEWVQMGANKFPLQRMKDTGERLSLPYVRIQKPGDNTTVIEEEVREDHKMKWPQQWDYFARSEGLIASEEMPGWKIEDWTHINHDSESVRNLRYLRFYTVEQIANASDAQVQRLGMGGYGLREAAKKAMQQRVVSGVAEQIAAKDKELAEMKARMERLEAALLSQPQAEPAPKNKGGRPKGSKNKPKDVSGEQHTS